MVTKTKERDLELIQNAPMRLHAVLEEYREKLSLTNGRSLVTPQARREHAEKIRAGADRRMAAIREETEAAYDRMHGSLTSVVRGADTSDDQTVQVKRQRAWDRLKPLLDSNRDPSNPERKDLIHVISGEAEKAGKARDLETIRMLEEELPAYLTANRLPEYASIVDQLLADAYVAARGGEQWAASIESDELAPLWNRVQVALNTADRGTEMTLDQDIILPGYEDGEVLMVESVPNSTEETDEDGQPLRSTNLPELSARY